MNIFLIGMMGAGKTYWAQRIADKLQSDWIDLDQMIEKETSMTIKEIFETNGEEFFRQKERDVLHTLSAIKNIVIATGGGTPCFHNNMEWMNENGITIWIDEPLHVLLKRLLPEKQNRPLIQNLSDDELTIFLSDKMEERKLYYSKAQHHVSGEKISLQDFETIFAKYV